MIDIASPQDSPRRQAKVKVEVEVEVERRPDFLHLSLGLSLNLSIRLADFISNLLGWEERAPTEEGIGTAEILAGL